MTLLDLLILGAAREATVRIPARGPAWAALVRFWTSLAEAEAGDAWRGRYEVN